VSRQLALALQNNWVLEFRWALKRAMASKTPQDRGSAFQIDRIFLESLEASLNRKES
jgi:hypothetical protein